MIAKKISIFISLVFLSSSMLFFTSCSSLQNIENNIPSIPNQKPPGNNETLPNPPTNSNPPNDNETKPPISGENKPPGNNETLPNPPADSNPPNGNEPKPPISEGNKPPINIPNEQLPTFLNKEFEKKVGDGSVRTQYSTSSYISKWYTRQSASTYSNDELKELWNETKFNIDDFPYPDNPNKDSFSRERYQNIIKSYGSGDISDNKYSMMNELGLIDLNKNGNLKKHPIADYQYGYDNRVTDDTKAVEKVFNIDINEKGFITTGLFLPPGETLEITINNLDDNEIGGDEKNYFFHVYIGNNESVKVEDDNIDDNSKPISFPKLWSYRMPVIKSRKFIDKKTIKFGTPMGGLVNILNFTNVTSDSKQNISMTIKGAVEAVNYVHGKTSEAEWNDQLQRYKNKTGDKKITAPIFNIVSDNIKFSGPIKNLKLENYDSQNKPKSYPLKIMDWWDFNTLSSFSLTEEFKNKNKTPVDITYSNYVPHGLAVAFPGKHYSILPLSSAEDIINYDKLLDSEDVWITLHELNHHNQSKGIWAFDEWVESTNNVLSLLSLLENSNFYSDRSDLSEKDNASNGHKFKLLSSNQIKQATELANKLSNSSQTRSCSDSDYTIIFSQLGPDIFRKYIKSYFYDEYATDYLNNKFDTKLNIGSSNSASIVYRLSIISGYDWSQYYAFTKLINENDKKLIQQKLKEKYPNIKTMIPVGSFYASKIKYGSEQKEWNKSSTPFYLKNPSNEYTFENKLLVDTATLNNNYKFGVIENFQIIEQPKFGTLTKQNNNDYKYKMNNGNDISVNNLDSFAYSFDVKDNDGNKNSVQFKVEIQLSKYAQLKQEKNETFISTDVIGPYSSQLGINGEWEKNISINNKLHNGKFDKQTLKSKNRNSEIGFNFIGDSFEIYGFNSKLHGQYDVYINGKLISSTTKNNLNDNENELQKLSSYKLNKINSYNVIIKPKNDQFIEISHFKFNGKLLDIKIKN